jgi:hypothetical protein
MYLRSTTVCTSFTGLFSFLSNVTTRCVKTSTAAALPTMVVTGVMRSFYIFHGGIIIAIVSTAFVCRQIRNFPLHIDFFSLQQGIHNLS